MQASSPAASAPVPGHLLPPGTRMGEFELLSLIGEGGFGIVYLAHDHSLDRRVAIKEYMPSSLAVRTQSLTVALRNPRHADVFQAGLASFINEARLLARFDHPALIKVHRFWEANGTAYMVMPYYRGQTLAATLKARPQAPDEAWLRGVLSPVLDALGLMHQDHVYHRDIAPDNIMLLEDGRPVVLDLGAARRVISDLTQTLTVILKTGYAPLEQYGDMPGLKQGPWTDLYALASVMYFAIQGQTPPPAVTRMVVDQYEPLSRVAAGRGYSEAFLRALDACLAVLPQKRPPSVAVLQALLAGTAVWPEAAPVPPLAAEPVAAPAVTPVAEVVAPPVAAAPTLPQSAKSRRPVVMAAAVGAAVLVAGVIGWQSAQRTGTVETAKTEAEAPEQIVKQDPSAIGAAASSVPAVEASAPVAAPAPPPKPPEPVVPTQDAIPVFATTPKAEKTKAAKPVAETAVPPQGALKEVKPAGVPVVQVPPVAPAPTPAAEVSAPPAAPKNDYAHQVRCNDLLRKKALEGVGALTAAEVALERECRGN